MAGVILCYLQLFVMKGYKDMLVVSGTESFNWVLMVGVLSVFNVVYLFFYYVFLMVLLIPSFITQSDEYVNWETVLVFINVPFSISFFVKIFALGDVIEFRGVLVVVVLFLMFLSLLSFSM